MSLNQRIRRVLVRHWVDLGRISIRTHRGVSFIHGTLVHISGHPSDLTPAMVAAITSEIGCIPRLRRVTFELENWTCTGAGVWKASAQPESAARAAMAFVSSAPAGIVLQDRDAGPAEPASQAEE